MPLHDEEYIDLGRFTRVQHRKARPLIWVTCGNALRITPLIFTMVTTGAERYEP